MLFSRLVKITGPGLMFCIWPLPESKSHLELLAWLQVQMAMGARAKDQRTDVRLASGLGPAIFCWKKRKVRGCKRFLCLERLNELRSASQNSRMSTASWPVPASRSRLKSYLIAGRQKFGRIGLMDDGLS
jgi:hypothetical protein